MTALQNAKPGMPTFYTGNDFVLIMLHYPCAGTISVSVTNEERVGRTMSESASTQGETTMNTSLNQGSARIYQFPAGGRSGVTARRQGETQAADLASSRVTEVAVSGAWYHDAAIQESKPVRDH
jgi:Protein of unknown function (DUF2735).